MRATKEVRKMKKLILAATLVAITPLMAKDHEAAQRLDAAAAVFGEVMGAPDKGIPQEMLEHAHCIVIVPELTFVVRIFFASGKT